MTPTQPVHDKCNRAAGAKVKKETMATWWIPGVNHHGGYDRWAFVEFTDVLIMQKDFETKVQAGFNTMVNSPIGREAHEHH